MNELKNLSSNQMKQNGIDQILESITDFYKKYNAMPLDEKIAIDAILCEHRNKDCNCVYFIRNKENGLVKIGSTGKFRKREKQISAIYKSYGNKIDILEPALIIKTGGIDPKYVEFNLHRVFSGKRMYGEWFSLDDKDFENVIYNYTTGTKIEDGICTGELYFRTLDGTAMENIKRHYEFISENPRMDLLLLRFLQLVAENEKIASPKVTFEEQFQICTSFSSPFMRYFEAAYGF